MEQIFPKRLNLAKLHILPDFLPQPAKNLHKYICHIRDISQLWSWHPPPHSPATVTNFTTFSRNQFLVPSTKALNFYLHWYFQTHTIADTQIARLVQFLSISQCDTFLQCQIYNETGHCIMEVFTSKGGCFQWYNLTKISQNGKRSREATFSLCCTILAGTGSNAT